MARKNLPGARANVLGVIVLGVIVLGAIVFGLTIPLAGAVEAQEPLPTPNQTISQLKQRIYTISETTGDQNRYDEALQKAAASIRQFIAHGDAAELTTTNKVGMTPLIYAAQYGYAPIVEELLKHPAVAQDINRQDDRGISAWDYSVLALRRSGFACNPAVFNNPFSFVPLMVTQIFYRPRNPYRETRRLLEQAGAKADMSAARTHWQTLCKNQSEKTRAKVYSAGDVQETVIAEGEAVLNSTLEFLKNQKQRRKN